MAAVGILFIVLPMTWACAPQKAGNVFSNCGSKSFVFVVGAI